MPIKCWVFYICYDVDNEIANEYWEYKLPASFKRPQESTEPAVSWQFIKDKYVKKLYTPKNANDPVTEYITNSTRSFSSD